VSPWHRSTPTSFKFLKRSENCFFEKLILWDANLFDCNNSLLKRNPCSFAIDEELGYSCLVPLYTSKFLVLVFKFILLETCHYPSYIHPLPVLSHALFALPYPHTTHRLSQHAWVLSPSPVILFTIHFLTVNFYFTNLIQIHSYIWISNGEIDQSFWTCVFNIPDYLAVIVLPYFFCLF
jgi:hypothetical protein